MKRGLIGPRLPIPAFRNSIVGPPKPVPARIAEDFFFSCFFLEEFLHRNVVLEVFCRFLFSAAFTGFFCRNSCRTGIPIFAEDSCGFLQNPVPAKSCLA